ncbi:hypothetical protein ACIBQX_43655 [Nonomuraea sp. NPDC049714]|uniref:hypothetical protein n=1 Tax=Nonomuraea sp. NPDC049714 TaxID=3364357 RepID=UPI00379F528D
MAVRLVLEREDGLDPQIGHDLFQMRRGEVGSVVEVEDGMPHTCQSGSPLRQIACRKASAVINAEGAARLTAYPAMALEW